MIFFKSARLAKASLAIMVMAICLDLASATTLAFTNLQQRSVFISSSIASANTTEVFSFYFPIAETVGSIQFQYCTDPIDTIPCATPSGLDASGASLDAQSGETGFAIVSAATNKLVIGRTPAIVGNQQNSYTFSNVINPNVLGPFFIRITAYASSDASGPLLSFSSVAASVDQQININSTVPDMLNFCTGIIVQDACAVTIGDFIEFGALLPSVTRFGTSQFIVGTNAVNGYNVTANGLTMTSGTDQISAPSSPTPSQTGHSQFGFNLTANSSPSQGAGPSGGSGTTAPNYSIANRYLYKNGDIVASFGGRSDHTLFTVSYIVNVTSSQPVGVYNTTITYVCTAGF